jgi:hypothetical protein
MLIIADSNYSRLQGCGMDGNKQSVRLRMDYENCILGTLSCPSKERIRKKMLPWRNF